MEGFTIIDGVVAIVIVVSALLAYSRGFVREVLAIAGWIGAAVLAFIFADQAQPLVRQIPVLGDYIGDIYLDSAMKPAMRAKTEVNSAGAWSVSAKICWAEPRSTTLP